MQILKLSHVPFHMWVSRILNQPRRKTSRAQSIANSKWKESEYIRTYIHTFAHHHIHMYIYIYVYVLCLCLFTMKIYISICIGKNRYKQKTKQTSQLRSSAPAVVLPNAAVVWPGENLVNINKGELCSIEIWTMFEKMLNCVYHLCVFVVSSCVCVSSPS